MEKPIIRITTDRRSCNACGAQNYKANSDRKTRYVDKIYEIVVSHMVSAVCPDCLRTLANTAMVMLDGAVTLPPAEDIIRFHIRDCNGHRDILEFRNEAEVLRWAEEDMFEDDEILLITQGSICIYSGLQADLTLTLTSDDITGYFA